jgi:hypothetical protein
MFLNRPQRKNLQKYISVFFVTYACPTARAILRTAEQIFMIVFIEVLH